MLDYPSRLSRISRCRQPSAIRKLAPLLSQPGMISLGGGLPNPQLFPFNNLSFRIGSAEARLSDAQVAESLQYSQTPGLPSLLKWIRRLQESKHRLPSNTSICISGGSQEAFCRAVEMLIEPGGHILVDDPCYSGVLAFLRPYCHITGVATDAHGIIPDELDRVLIDWRGSSKPRVLYTNVTASNPTGATLSADRRRALYSLAERHDLIILEDDPYYFLHEDHRSLPSLLSLDECGRVIRFDSLSKVLSSGIRIGFATGPQPLIDRINLHTQAYNLHTSGVSQMMVSALFDHWKLDGFDHHIQQCSKFYNQRRDQLLQAAETHLKGRAYWNIPEAGMFLWMRLHSIPDTRVLIEDRAVQARVLFVPGQAFCPRGQPSSYIRASYSTATALEMDEAMRRLAALIQP